ncbi:MAG: hypothetical protein IJJ69_02680 [Oscillospiraceae bacterium]|nr:hypothetical protein [Oscillospiraceae bacterium]
MKKCMLLLLTVLFLPVWTACAQETQGLSYLEAVSSDAPSGIENSYVSLKQKFPELYQQLWFTVDVPESLELYDNGKTDGVVRFADPSGKNLLTLETRFKEQPERYYQQYLHTVCANLSELGSFHEYDETFSVNGYSARRLDVKQNAGSETRLISYWFLAVEEAPDTAKYYHQSGVCVIAVESTAENIEAMLRIPDTFRMRENET